MNVQRVQFYTIYVKCRLHALHGRAGKLNISIQVAKLRLMVNLTIYGLHV